MRNQSGFRRGQIAGYLIVGLLGGVAENASIRQGFTRNIFHSPRRPQAFHRVRLAEEGVKSMQANAMRQAYFIPTSETLWPPKPKELLSAEVTVIWRDWAGT